MSKLTMEDMNSLNAIAGYLRTIGAKAAADVLLDIQRRATPLVLELEAINRRGGQ